jgi:hypothetical protein
MTNFVITLLPPKPFTNRKTHCKRGHEFTPESTYHRIVLVKNKRYTVRECKLCMAIRGRKSRQNAHK